MFTYEDLKIEIHPEVYDPAEDTFLLLKSIKIFNGALVFEIGTGTGIIALFCAKHGANVVCSDINPFSIETVEKNYKSNESLLKGRLDIRMGDLYSVLESDEFFDIIIFNPPYLPTKPKDIVGGSGWFDKSVDGGVDGLNVIKRFLNGLPLFLKKNGRAYFVFSSLSDEKSLRKILDKNKLEFDVVVSQRFNDEVLDVYCVWLK